MGHIKKPQPVKLLAGLLYSGSETAALAKRLAENAFGRVDYESPEIDFSQTDYYREEMGPCLKRRFYSFEKPVDPAAAYASKLKTNAIEARLSKRGRRTVNIDPGILSLSRLILFTTKDYSHRIYMGRGIFAEITLIFEKDGFRALPWTYPDYRQASYSGVFRQIRGILKDQLRERNR